MSISGLRKASWYNPDDGTVVQANDIAEGGEFYTRAIEDPDDQTATGEAPYAGDESYCELMVFDMSLKSQLEAWEENDTRISMVAAGVQQNIQWYERDLVSVKPVYPVAAGRRNHLNVVMERTGHGAHDIHANINLLAHLGWKGSDDNADGVPDGYFSNFDVVAFSDQDSDGEGEEFQGKAPTNGAAVVLRGSFDFPISGVSLTQSGNFTQIHDDGDTLTRVRLFSYGGTNIDTKESSVFASTGRKKLDVTLGSNVYEIQAEVLLVRNATAQNAAAHIQFPAVRVDGDDTYVSY